jgi:Fic family protein
MKRGLGDRYHEEQNTLTLEQVTDVINGKRILGPPQDIHEVKNAYEAYERVSVLDPYSVSNLLLAHRMMMDGLVKEAGSFRSGNVGVYAGAKLIHAGTPAKYVPDLIQQLFTWLKKSKLHPLVKSCIFHYEFEYIHPFQDGNGRTGRLWQSLILQKWKDIFTWLPVEILVYENQQEYYDVLGRADKNGESTEFVEFMLGMIRDALQEISNAQNNYDVVINVAKNVVTNEDKILSLLKQDNCLSANMLAVSHKDRHQKIGLGEIGEEALMNVVRHPLLQGRPFILETPNEDEGYAEEIARVKTAMKK